MSNSLDPDIVFDEKVLKRFIDKLQLNPNNDCIEWTGKLNQDGYGQISVGSREEQSKIRAHRWAFQLFIGGQILDPSIMICHHCDNRKCVAPDHLFAGTHQDNMDDMVNKGRSAKGINVRNNSHLTIEQVSNIKYGKEPYSYYVDKYNISKSTVSDIRNGRTWTEV